MESGYRISLRFSSKLSLTAELQSQSILRKALLGGDYVDGPPAQSGIT